MKKKILILTQSGGHGHIKPAKAIKKRMMELLEGLGRDTEIEIIDFMKETGFYNYSITRFLNFCSRLSQRSVLYYLKFMRLVKIYKPYFKILWLNKAENLFRRHQPVAGIICVAPQVVYKAVYTTSRLGMAVPVLSVLTDPGRGFIRGWCSPDITRCYVPTPAALKQCLQYGIPPEKVEVTGFPIDIGKNPYSRMSARRRLKQLGELSKVDDRIDILILAGAFGSSSFCRLVRKISLCGLEGNLWIISGKNERLKRKLESFKRTRGISIEVIGFTDQMDLWLRAADAVFTKPGGSTCFEAVAACCPLIIKGFPVVFPQEQGVIDFVRDHDLGFVAADEDNLVKYLREFCINPSMGEKIRGNMKTMTGCFGLSTLCEKFISHFDI